MAEIMTTMVPLMDYYKEHPGLGPREALNRVNAENSHAQLSLARMQQNVNAAVANGQGPFLNQRTGMNPPNQSQIAFVYQIPTYAMAISNIWYKSSSRPTIKNPTLSLSIRIIATPRNQLEIQNSLM